jgi:WXG100 family type VII secretion target
MSLIDVDSVELRQQSQAVQKGAETVDETVQHLTNQVRDLANRWKGAASESFQTLWDEWQSSATQLHEAMQGIGDFLRNAAETYEGAEDSIKSSSGH